MKTLRDKRAAAGSLGGQSTLKKYGSDHFRKIGVLGAATTWKRYGLKPVGTSQYAMVHRETNEIKAFFSGVPFKK